MRNVYTVYLYTHTALSRYDTEVPRDKKIKRGKQETTVKIYFRSVKITKTSLLPYAIVSLYRIDIISHNHVLFGRAREIEQASEIEIECVYVCAREKKVKHYATDLF